jgi:hypothetical protein
MGARSGPGPPSCAHPDPVAHGVVIRSCEFGLPERPPAGPPAPKQVTYGAPGDRCLRGAAVHASGTSPESSTRGDSGSTGAWVRAQHRLQQERKGQTLMTMVDNAVYVDGRRTDNPKSLDKTCGDARLRRSGLRGHGPACGVPHLAKVRHWLEGNPELLAMGPRPCRTRSSTRSWTSMRPSSPDWRTTSTKLGRTVRRRPGHGPAHLWAFQGSHRVPRPQHRHLIDRLGGQRSEQRPEPCAPPR